jgi:hypothetical protein
MDIQGNTTQKNVDPFQRLYTMEFDKPKEVKADEVKPDDKEVVKEEVKPEVKPDEKLDEKPEVKAEVKSEVEPVEYDEIVYNKETVKLPVSERKTYLQKGYNYDKVKAAADEAKAKIEESNAKLAKLAKAYGYDKVEDFELDAEMQFKSSFAEKLEEAIGDPDKIDEIVRNHPEVVKTKEEKRKLEYERIKAEYRNTDPYFKELEAEFDRVMDLNPTARPDYIYKIMRSDFLTPQKINELITKEKESVEKKVLADIHDKERRATPQGGDSEGNEELVQANDFTRKISSIFGVPSSKVARKAHEKLKRS